MLKLTDEPFEHYLSVDLETRSSQPLRGNARVGLHKYFTCPQARILICCYAIDDMPVQTLDLNNNLQVLWFIGLLTNPKYRKRAANAGFEMEAFRALLGVEIIPNQWECSLAKAYTCGMSGGLDQVSRILGVGSKVADGKKYISFFSVPQKQTKAMMYKDQFGAIKYREWNEPKDHPEEFKKFVDYCVMDVELERKIAKMLNGFKQPVWERAMWILDWIINNVGFLVDEIFVHAALRMNELFMERTLQEIVQITGVTNAKSVSQIKTWLSEELSEELDQDIIVNKLNKEAIPKILKLTNDVDIKRVLHLRELTAKASTSKYSAMLRNWLSDGRVKGLLQYYGAQRTGRWAGRLVQSHNLPKTEMKDLDYAREIVSPSRTEAITINGGVPGNMDYLAMMFKSVPFALSQLIRTAFMAPIRHELIVSDFSAIEARALAWMAGELWRLEVFTGHGKIYEASASFMFGIPIEKVDAEQRQSGKVAELALGYGGAEGALTQMIRSAAVTARELDKPFSYNPTKEELTDIKFRWRAANKNICKFWQACNNAALAAVENPGVKITRVNIWFEGMSYEYVLPHGLAFVVKSNVLFIVLPSGRSLCYLRPRIVDGKFGPAVSYEGNEKGTGSWGRVETYGGKIVENIVQAISRDILGQAMIRLHEAGFKLVMHVHDEVIIEAPINMYEVDQVDNIMRQQPNWAPGLPLGTKTFKTKFYKKD